jgi:hypothetical protein
VNIVLLLAKCRYTATSCICISKSFQIVSSGRQPSSTSVKKFVNLLHLLYYFLMLLTSSSILSTLCLSVYYLGTWLALQLPLHLSDTGCTLYATQRCSAFWLFVFLSIRLEACVCTLHWLYCCCRSNQISCTWYRILSFYDALQHRGYTACSRFALSRFLYLYLQLLLLLLLLVLVLL